MSVQSPIRSFQVTEITWIFIFSFFVLWNLGFHTMIYFPMDLSPDIQNYLAMAQLDFDQSPVRRYRIIIPMLAYVLNTLLGGVFDLFHPWSFDQDFSLCFSFLMINTLIMSWVNCLLYNLCRHFQLSSLISLIVVVAICCSRWSAEISGLPLVDSLYFACLVMAIYGLVIKNWTYVIASIWLGPWAKEAYIFMAPVILLFADSQRWRCMIHLVLSGLLVFAFRFSYDSYLGHNIFLSIREDLSSVSSIQLSLKRLFSFHGLYDIFSILGFWLFIPFFAAIRYFTEFVKIFESYRSLFIVYISSVILQALLSSDISRMFYLSMPVLAIWLGAGLMILNKHWKILG